MIHHKNHLITILVRKSFNGGLSIHQNDDLVFVTKEQIREFVSAVQTVAYDILGEELYG